MDDERREKLDDTKTRGRHLVTSRFGPRFVIYYTFSVSPSTIPDTSVGAEGAFCWVRLCMIVHDCHDRRGICHRFSVACCRRHVPKSTYWRRRRRPCLAIVHVHSTCTCMMMMVLERGSQTTPTQDRQGGLQSNRLERMCLSGTAILYRLGGIYDIL